MVLEIAKPVSLLLSILSLYGVFQAAFLVTAISLDDRIAAALLRLALAAAIALIGALIFREAEIEAEAHFDADLRAHFGAGFGRPFPPTPPLVTTLPMQLFCWASAAMLVLFAVSWYLETYYIPYANAR